MDSFTSLYNGVTGLNSMSQKLSVTANNVANANTTGFKSGSAKFADILESNQSSVSIGLGVQLGAIGTSFADGAITNTGRSTDMAVNGQGFFQVRNADRTTADRYTRNGEFDLIEHQGSEPNTYNLVTSGGQFVQGINLSTGDPATTVASDILIKRTTPQVATTQVEVITNLEDNPALIEEINTPLFASWDGRKNGGVLDEEAYDYKTSMKIYGPDDETATTTSFSSFDYLTIYYDSTSNQNEKEFLLTCDPALDQRVLSDGTTRYDSTTDKGAGALLYGILHFNNNGDLSDIECWNVPADGALDPSSANKLSLIRGESFYNFEFNFSGDPANSTSTINFGNLPKPQEIASPGAAFTSTTSESTVDAHSSWATTYDSWGNLAQAGDTIRFQGKTGDGTPTDYTYTVDPAQTMEDLLIGLQNQFACTAEMVNGKLTLTDSVVGDSQLSIDSITYAHADGATPLTDPTVAQLFGSQGAAFAITPEDRYTGGPLATTNYASPSSTLYQDQNGFGRGLLQDIHVNREGIITGEYSNGQEIEQAQLVLADFVDLQGLRTEANNIFVATGESGPAILGTPGHGSFGTMTNNTLEMSNVDIGREMADLIITQRAFQANSKSITTSDAIYDSVLQLIRR